MKQMRSLLDMYLMKQTSYEYQYKKRFIFSQPLIKWEKSSHSIKHRMKTKFICQFLHKNHLKE